MKRGFVFHPTFADALRLLDDADRLAAYDALVAYAIDGVDPPAGTAGAIVALMKPLLDANAAKYDAAVENGKKGGRPRKENPDETSEKPVENPKETSGKPNGNPDETIKKNINIKEKKTLTNVSVKEKSAPRSALGAYKHVLLTDADLVRLDDDFGHDTVKEAIKIVDEYCQTSGKRYKDYNLVLRKWGIPEAQKKRASPRGNQFTAMKTNIYDFGALERELVENY